MIPLRKRLIRASGKPRSLTAAV